MWVCAYKCSSGLRKPEVSDSPEAGVSGSCGSPSMGAGNEPDFSAGQQALSATEQALYPLDVDLEFTRGLNSVCKNLFSKVTHSEVKMRRPPAFSRNIVHQQPDDTLCLRADGKGCGWAGTLGVLLPGLPWHMAPQCLPLVALKDTNSSF